ncbi:MAG: NUDIX domain-containing protein [Bacteroidota bacterium]|nr:NUDIX domain-containing protein [Bacteroidota bacterium]
MHKIFFNNKCIELVGDSSDLVPGTMRIEYENAHSFEYALEVLANRKDVTCIRIEHSNANILLEKLLLKFKNILAAGGLAENESGELLLIFRHNKWDLPKGKLKKKEDVPMGAIREVEEECGVKNLSIVGTLNPTYHIYQLKEQLVIKKTFWFKMFCEKNQVLTPQLDEGITKVEWFKKQDLKTVYKNTYGSITQVLKEYMSN